MFYLIGIIPILILFLGGCFAVIRFFIRNKENSIEIIDRLVPYKTWVGVALLLWGIISLIGFLRILRFIPASFEKIPITTIASLISTFVSIALGVVLSMNYLRTDKNTPIEKIHALDKKLYPTQTILGFIAFADSFVLFFASVYQL